MKEHGSFVMAQIGMIKKNMNICKMGSEVSGVNNNTWLTVTETAAYLRVSVSKIRKMVARKQIPFRRLPGAAAGKIVFNRRMLDFWILLNGKKSVSQVERRTLGVFL